MSLKRAHRPSARKLTGTLPFLQAREFEESLSSMRDARAAASYIATCGISSASSMDFSAGASAWGVSAGESASHSRSSASSSKEEVAQARQKSSQCSAHLIIKYITRKSVILQKSSSLRLSPSALELLRLMCDKLHLRDVGEQTQEAESSLARLIRQFFDDFGSHAFCGPFLFGGKMTTLGESKALEDMSALSIRKTVATTTKTLMAAAFQAGGGLGPVQASLKMGFSCEEERQQGSDTNRDDTKKSNLCETKTEWQARCSDIRTSRAGIPLPHTRVLSVCAHKNTSPLN